ncbi:MAG TPA: DUF1549 and DUF1553 domain-containing protein [Gemmataceae bacterium]|jgi:hypothetical protein|nr:DUF1549 and DUF1553 domain-containing protein [Gemmataceae bacterium]
MRCVTLLLMVVGSTLHAAPPEEHWAWKLPVRSAVPAGMGANPIDAFIRARLTIAKLTPAAPATREHLIRRVTFDLTGLPPTPEEIDGFVNDKSPDAWARVVDRLLASPAYGERWGRHWLDLARYADSNGYEFDEPRPDAWRYRDYVIRSFNADKPFDRFILEQLAGDEALPNDRDARIATGFNLLGPDMTDASDQVQRRHNTLTDMTDTAGLAFLGLTIACARCHDHKFEPLPQTDYYRLQAFFTPADFRRDLPIATATEKVAQDAAARDYLAKTKAIRDDIAAIEGPHRTKLFESKLAKLSAEAQAAHRTPADKRTGGQQELVAETEKKVAITAAEIAAAMNSDERMELIARQKELKAFDALKPPPLPIAMGLADKAGAPPKTHLLERGELSRPAAEVRPGFPTALGGKSIETDAGRRLALAKWIASPDNPLTARVIVNRLWQHHFGRGIVATPSDFGIRGERPTHPELLDWLACELVAGDWQLKRIHRHILLSETYQQSTNAGVGTRNADPDNHLLARMSRQRLEGEAVRDALLAVSGRLNRTAGGPGVVLPGIAGPGGGAKAAPVSTDPADHVRRSVYLFARRNKRDPFLEAFDLPDSNLSCPKRERSTTAPQALAMLNANEAAEAAKALAERLQREGSSDGERVERAYRLVLGRSPSTAERERAMEFLRGSPMSELCRALLNLSEFVYLD